MGLIGKTGPIGGAPAEAACRAVFGVLKTTLPAGDVADTAQELPADLRALWDEA